MLPPATNRPRPATLAPAAFAPHSSSSLTSRCPGHPSSYAQLRSPISTLPRHGSQVLTSKGQVEPQPSILWWRFRRAPRRLARRTHLLQLSQSPLEYPLVVVHQVIFRMPLVQVFKVTPEPSFIKSLKIKFR